MAKLAIIATLAALSLGAWPCTAIADEVPTFDVRTNCHAHTSPEQTGNSERACLAGEQSAPQKAAATPNHSKAKPNLFPNLHLTRQT